MSLSFPFLKLRPSWCARAEHARAEPARPPLPSPHVFLPPFPSLSLTRLPLRPSPPPRRQGLVGCRCFAEVASAGAVRAVATALSRLATPASPHKEPPGLPKAPLRDPPGLPKASRSAKSGRLPAPPCLSQPSRRRTRSPSRGSAPVSESVSESSPSPLRVRSESSSGRGRQPHRP